MEKESRPPVYAHEDSPRQNPLVAKFEQFGFGLLLIFILIVPLFYGGVTYSARLLIEVVAFTAASIAIIAGYDRVPPRALTGLAFAVLAIAAVGCIQLIPLSSSTLGRVSPTSAGIYQESEKLLAQVGTPASAYRISLAPPQTARTALLIAAYAVLALGSHFLVRTPSRWRAFRMTLILAGTIQILLGMAEGFVAQGIRGTFLVSNHLAAYLQITAAMAGAGWISRGGPVSPGRTANALTSASLVFLYIGLALTRSVAGVVAAVFGAATLFLLRYAATRERPLLKILPMVVPIAAIEMTLLLPHSGLDASMPASLASRMEMWLTSMHAWVGFPFLGSGLGTFAEAFQSAPSPVVRGLVAHAHNDFLQLLVTGGLTSVIFAAAAYLCVCLMVSQERALSASMLAAAASVFPLVLHGSVEFNFSIPAIPATLACVVGAATAMHMHRENGQIQDGNSTG